MHVRATDLKRATVLTASLLLLAAAALLSNQARSQELDPDSLEALVAPVALYPDDVLGIILPASTFPLDVVRAARFLDDKEEYPELEPDSAWDDSVVALLNYPEVVYLMNDDIDWTWELGEAVLLDQEAVLEAAQNFRERAYAVGNLRTDEKQIVSRNDGAIEIVPAEPEVVYIPIYEPREVIVYQPRPIYRYYPVGYPVYYYPYPAGYTFATDWFWGVTSYFSVGWHSHHVHVHHHTHRRHPYYLNSYYFYSDYYPRNSVNITVSVNNYDNVWRPTRRQGSGPRSVTVERRSGSTRATGRTITTETQPNISTTRASSATNSAQRSASGSRTTTLSRSADSARASERATQRSNAARSEATRSVPSSSQSASQARSFRTTQPTVVTPPASRAPSTRTPNNSSVGSRTRTTISSQGGSTRRSTSGNSGISQSRSSSSSSRSSTSSSPRQAPSRSSAPTRTRER